MPFIDDILRHDSLSIVGLEKNTGKTECLKYVLERLPLGHMRVAVTSIGIDGETIDQVTRTQKPEITLRRGMYFGTSEAHYRQRRLVSEVVDLSEERTSMGRIVTARAVTDGKILLSGPASSAGLRRWMSRRHDDGIDLVIIDGALSRLSLASPAVSRAMILATGAALSASMDTLVQRTAFVVELINLPLADEAARHRLTHVEQGVWSVDEDGNVCQINGLTALSQEISFAGMEHCRTLYVAGALVDGLLEKVRKNKALRQAEIVVRDFTKIFVSPQQYRAFIKGGGHLHVLQRSTLIAVTVNPTSPTGYRLDSDTLCRRLAEAIHLPVYDLMRK